MALSLRDCRFTGPALPEPFVLAELENELSKRKLLPKNTGAEGKQLQRSWDIYRRVLRELVLRGGPIRVSNKVLEPLVERLGYDRLEKADDVQTREGLEAGGHHLLNGEAKLRVWSTDLDIDLDAPAKRGAAYRYSHIRIAQRVLLTAGERVGLITNGVELRVLISDPARPDSQVEIPIDPGWKRSRDVPDSYRLLVALCSPEGLKALPEIIDKARLQQTKVTKELRVQARQAVERFVQEILDNPDNRSALDEYSDRQQLARELWREGLVIIYRLLFILKLESTDDPARSFSFASTSLWRNTFSPAVALAPMVRRVLDEGAVTGRFLEDGLRVLFRMFTEGLQCTELNVQPLGGALFGENATPIVSRLRWGERAVAYLLDRLLWTPKKRGGEGRERVHYGPLDVEDLGRVYEALLELEPGITTEPMCRLRRQKLEVVVPVAQGEKYRSADVASAPRGGRGTPENTNDEDDTAEEDEVPRRGKKTKVEWIEQIPATRFYLRVGLGRKSTGSYYTPHSFVRFLVQETLGPQVEEKSPRDDPKPCALLELKVLDPAMGSGHFLVEACRFLGERMYEACRLCDERALELEQQAEKARRKGEREKLLAQVAELRQRVIDLPDPDDEIVRYLPSRSPEGEETGYSQQKALALCRRMVAVHCLYGVDKNPLAVELAKLSLWIESHAEGLPLTFVDHRLVIGDSLTGPFFDKLIYRPGSGEIVSDLYRQRIHEKFPDALREAIQHVHLLEASVGVNLAELEDKRRLKAELDRALRPFRIVAAAWSGGVMLGPEQCDDAAYGDLMKPVGQTGELPERIESERLRTMIARGLGVDNVPAGREALYDLLASAQCVPALPYDLAFPEVFYPTGVPFDRRGFDTVLGNPPWDAIQFKSKEFFASFDFEILNAATKRERSAIEKRLTADPEISALYERYKEDFEEQKRVIDALYEYQKIFIDGDLCGRQLDQFRVFMERNAQLLGRAGLTGVVVPSAFHANEGATGVRRLYLEKMMLRMCYSFENRRKLFEIHASFKFALIVACNDEMTVEFACAFYLHDDEWLFSDRRDRPALSYRLEFVQRTGGEYLAFQEIQRAADGDVAQTIALGGSQFKQTIRRAHMRFGREFDVGSDEPYINRDGNGLPILEGKSFHQFTDRWEPPQAWLDQEVLGRSATAWRHYRLSFRRVASSTNERTSIWALLPPGTIGADSNPIEQSAEQRATSIALWILGTANCYAFDFQLRLRVGANVSPFLVELCVLPSGDPRVRSHVVRNSVRLTCNHTGYEPLWREQLGDEWREDKPPFTWPVLEGDDARWAVRAGVDAVVADAYGLSREQYAHVLSTFSHASYPRAPELCLARFDELKQIGLGAFTKKYDPYWDIPLNENLPQPVIDLPIPEGSGSGAQGSGDLPLFAQAQSGEESGGEAADGAQSSSRATRPARGRPKRRRRQTTSAGESDFDPERAYQELLGYLRNQREITSSDAQALLGATATQVRPLLKRLVDEGHARTEGQRRGMKYVLKG